MSDAEARPIVCVVGAGPIGLEAATLCAAKGFSVELIERGDNVAASLLDWGHVRLFSSNDLNTSAWGTSACAKAGASPLDPAARPTGKEFVQGYLDPMAEQLKRTPGCHVRTNTTVLSISRGEVLKNEAVKAVGETDRDTAPFTVVCSDERCHGEFSLSNIAAVIDCSGTYGNGNSLGIGGSLAVDERSLRKRPEVDDVQIAWFDTLPDVCGRDRQSFMPHSKQNARRVALVGGGYSAATTLLSLVAHAKSEADITLQVDWLLRRGAGREPYARVDDDPLPDRAALVDAANKFAEGQGDLPPNMTLKVHRGVVIEQCGKRYYEVGIAGREQAPTASSAASAVGSKRAIDEVACREREGRVAFDLCVDVLVSHVGFRPDMAMTRELQVHHCYASEGPMKLAASLLSARVAASKSGNGAAAGDCLNQAAPGPDLMRNPEPRFFICGAKSYGRNSAFLLSLGHAQVEAVVGILADELCPPPCAPCV